MNTVKLKSGDDFAAALDALPADSELLLPRGATFETTRTPAVRRDGVRIGSHGDADAPAPVIRARGCRGLYAANRRDVVVSGIRFQGAGDPADKGVMFYKSRRMTLEDCDVSGFIFGVTVEGLKPSDCSDVAIRRCHIHDNWHPQRKHSSGLYASFTDRLVIEHNVFDTNGWRVASPARGATMYNHNCYLQSNNGPAVVRGNIFANASSHGLQQRCGGACEGNVFLDNPVHMSYGLINGAAGFVGGVSGAIRGNVYVGSRDIDGSPRGWAVELANILKVTVADLLVAHDRENNAIAIQVNVPRDVTNPEQLVGIVDLEFAPTVYVWDWPKGKFWKNRAIAADGAGIRRLGRLVVPARWDPPVGANLTKIVNLAAVRLLTRRPLGPGTAAGLIRACRAACGLETPTEPAPPSAPDVPGALAAAVEARELLPENPSSALAKIEQVIEFLS
jgi:hypothetical protein